MTVRKDLGGGKLVAVGKRKFTGKRELVASDLPDVRALLALVRSFTSFAATLKA